MFLFPDKALQMCSFYFCLEEQINILPKMIVKHRTLQSIQISSVEKPYLEGFNGYFNELVINKKNGLS